MRSKDFVLEFLRKLVGALFIFSGLTKSIDPMGTAIKLNEYMAALSLDTLEPLAMPLAVVLCAVETMIGLLLLYGLYRRLAVNAATIFMLFFTLLTLYIVIYSPVKDCGCFGDALVISNEATFIKNLIFLTISIVLVCNNRVSRWRRNSIIATSIAASIALGIPIYSIVWLPPIDFMPYNVGVNIAQEMAFEGTPSEYKTTLIYKNIGDGSIYEFEVDDTTWHDESQWEYLETKSILISEGQGQSISSFDIIDKDGFNQFDRVIPSSGRYIALVINSVNLSESDLHKIEGLYRASFESETAMFALSPLAIDDVKGVLKDIDIEVFNMDETLVKSIVRAKNGYILFEDGTIAAKRNLSSASYIDSSQQLDSLSKNSSECIYFITIFVIFTVGFLFAYRF